MNLSCSFIICKKKKNNKKYELLHNNRNLKRFSQNLLHQQYFKKLACRWNLSEKFNTISKPSPARPRPVRSPNYSWSSIKIILLFSTERIRIELIQASVNEPAIGEYNAR